MESPKKRLGAGRVAFLARKEDIKKRLEAGYTMVTLYDEYQKDLGISYGQFVNYVNKFIRKKSADEIKQSEVQEVTIAKKNPAAKKDFTFNPKLDKDLY